MSERSVSSVPLSPATGPPLTSTQFRTLSEVPSEIEWFASIESLNDLRGFMAFAGIISPEDFASSRAAMCSRGGRTGRRTTG